MVRRAAVFLLLIAATAIAGQRLVPLPADTFVFGRSSFPRDFVRIGSTVYFLANDAVHGQQLWRTDGTERGTVQASAVPWDVLAIYDSSWRRLVVRLDDGVVFLTGDGRLWRCDGTPASTKKLGQLPGVDYAALVEGSVLLIGAGSRVYLLVPGGRGMDIYVVDGKSDSAHLVGSFPALTDPVPLGVDGKLYFAGKDDIAGAQVWVSDGTPAGTHMVRRNLECPGSACNPVAPRAFFSIGTAVYFLTDDGLWNADSTKIAPLDHPRFLTSTDSVAYLGVGQALWKTDGTPSGTRALLTKGSFTYLHVLDDGRLVFLEYIYSRIAEIWVSDGTAAGTRKIASLPTFDFQSPFIAAAGSRVFFSGATNEAGRELWLADVDRGSAELLKDIDPRFSTLAYSSSPKEGIVLGSNVIFAATSGLGTEPWISDGTAAGTKILANIAADNDAGALSGTVRDAATGAPVAGATVSICPNTGTTSCWDIAVADAAGHYRFDDVPPWTVALIAASRAHLTQRRAVPVTVVAGFELTGVDFSLTPGSRISGTVRRAATGEPLANVDVLVWSGNTYLDRTTTDANGNYRSRGLDTGIYLLHTSASEVSPAVANQLYSGKNCAFFCDHSGGTPVAVTLGQETTGIDFALDAGGTISGSVRDASNNAPLPGIKVDVFGLGGGGYSKFAVPTTDANGAFDSGLLPPDTYSVCIQSTQGYDGVCSEKVLSAKGALTVNVLLTQKQGRVTGIVRDRNGAPLPRLDVYVRDATRTIATGTSNEQGRYTFYGIAPGSYFIHAVDEEVPVTVAAGQTIAVDLPLHSLRSTISGRLLDGVTGESIGKAAGGVEAYDESGRQIGTARIDNGAYQFDVVSRAAVLYVVANTPAYHAMAYPGVRVACAPSCVIPPGAAALPPGPHSGIDFVLPRHGSFSGTVTDALTGAPVTAASVVVVSNGGRTGTIVDGSGRYRVYGEGSYTAFAGQGAYAGQVYRDHDCSAGCDPANGDAIVVADGIETPGIDFHLRPVRPAGMITGRVVDAESGAPLANAAVFGSINGPLTTLHTDAEGTYTLSSVPSGSYSFSASAQGAYFDLFDIPVTVTALRVSVVDFRLTRLHVTSVDPPRGTPAGGTPVTIAGRNFRQGMLVTIGDKRATVVSVTPTEIVALTPPGAEGVANVTVFMSTYPAVTLTQAYTYAPPLPPRRRATR